MAITYQIILSNGTFLTAIPETAINTTSTSLDLFGRGLTEYGEKLQNNLVHLLENFADSSPPSNPIVGQLWYDTTLGAIKVFSGVEFVDLKDIPNGTVINDSIAALAGIELSKLEKGTTPGEIIVVDSANFAQYVTMTGDVSIDDSGIASIIKDIVITLSGAVSGSVNQNDLDGFDLPTTLANNIVDSTNIQNFAVTETKLGSSSVSTVKLQDLAVTTSKLQNNSVTSDKLGSSAVTVTKIADGAVNSNKLATGAVNSSALGGSAIQSQHFSASSIPTLALQASSVSTTKIQDGAITESKLAASSVTVDKLAHNGTAASGFLLSFNGSSLEFTAFGGSVLKEFSIEANKLVQPFLTADYGGLVATPFLNEVTSQDLATTQDINIDYGGI